MKGYLRLFFSISSTLLLSCSDPAGRIDYVVTNKTDNDINLRVYINERYQYYLTGFDTLIYINETINTYSNSTGLGGKYYPSEAIMPFDSIFLEINNVRSNKSFTDLSQWIYTHDAKYKYQYELVIDEDSF